MTPKQKDRAEHIFLFMEWKHVTDDQHNLLISFEEQFENKGYLSNTQMDILESIFNQANEKA